MPQVFGLLEQYLEKCVKMKLAETMKEWQILFSYGYLLQVKYYRIEQKTRLRFSDGTIG